MTVLKVCGPLFFATPGNSPNTVATNVSAGSNAGFGNGTYSGFGNATPGGATHMFIVNAGVAAANVTVSNSGSNVGTIQILANTSLILEKYAYDTITVSANLFVTPIAARW